LPLFILSIYF